MIESYIRGIAWVPIVELYSRVPDFTGGLTDTNTSSWSPEKLNHAILPSG